MKPLAYLLISDTPNKIQLIELFLSNGSNPNLDFSLSGKNYLPLTYLLSKDVITYEINCIIQLNSIQYIPK